MKLSLFTLHTVLFPGMALPLHIFEPRYRRMIGECLESDAPFGVVFIRAGGEVGRPAAPYRVGTLARITRVEPLPDGRLNIEALGLERFRIRALQLAEAGYLTGEVEPYPLLDSAAPASQAAAQRLAPYLSRYLELLGRAAATQIDPQRLPQATAALAYLAAIVAQIPMLEKQALLSVPGAAALLCRERALFRREISLLRAMLEQAGAQRRAAICPN